MNLSLQFLGASGTVTGSKYLLSDGRRNYLIDCGLFQGPRKLDDLNWEPLPFDVKQLDAVILTHAHIDHTGYLPRLIRDGYSGPVHASEGTCALLRLLLPDSGFLQEEQAKYINKKGYSKKSIYPLYTQQQAFQALKSLVEHPLGESFVVDDQCSITLRSAGHILGSSILECDINGLKIVFSGDLGRYDQEVMKSPTSITEADALLVESTYGNRLHGQDSLETQLADVVNAVVERKGVLLIPGFAVGRTQHILYFLRKLQDKLMIPKLPIAIDSPMSTDATHIYCQFGNEHNLNVNLIMDDRLCPLRCPETQFIQSVEDSKRLNFSEGPRVIISASGMCNGGRIVHHLKHRLPDPKNAVLFVGYQSLGTRGRALVEGAKEVKIHGDRIPVRAQITSIGGLSAHADYQDLLRWLSGFHAQPQQTFIVHGEPQASQALQAHIKSELGWATHVARHREIVVLGRGRKW